jgi:hypothetical protein
MHDAPTTPAGRRIPFKQEGWGAALFICLLALATAATATYVHRRTYLDPTDVRMRAAGTRADTVGSSGH